MKAIKHIHLSRHDHDQITWLPADADNTLWTPEVQLHINCPDADAVDILSAIFGMASSSSSHSFGTGNAYNIIRGGSVEQLSYSTVFDDTHFYVEAVLRTELVMRLDKSDTPDLKRLAETIVPAKAYLTAAEYMWLITNRFFNLTGFATGEACCKVSKLVCGMKHQALNEYDYILNKTF